MSKQTFVINRTMLENMMLNPAQFTLGENLLKLSLSTPILADEKNRKNLAKSGKLQTKENHAENLENLQDSALLQFSLEIIAPIVYTSYSHELLAKQNDSAQEYSTKFIAYANDSAIELSETEFLGESLDSAAIHKLIRLYVSQSKAVTKISQNWRKRKGSYEVKVNGEFIPYSLPKAIPASMEESENLIPVKAKKA